MPAGAAFNELPEGWERRFDPGCTPDKMPAPESPPARVNGARPDVRGQQQGQGVLLKGMCIFCKAPVYNSQPRHSNAHGKFL